MRDKKLFILDIMPLLYRAHFATMGKRFGTTTGIDTRTTLVFFNYLFQLLTEQKPDAIVGALDSKAKQRLAVSENYKANREKMPSEISEAFPYAMRLMDALQIPVIIVEGYEADDIIATIAKKGEEEDYRVFIVSPDKDFAQLVSDNVFLFRPAYKGATMETLDAMGVKEKYGVTPAQIADYLALRGDSVDNITGIKGIGDKTAAQLLAEYQSVEELIARVEEIKQPKLKEAISTATDQLLQNKSLAVLTGGVELSIVWQEFQTSPPDVVKLLPLLDELQFVQIKERLQRLGFIGTQAERKDDRETGNSIAHTRASVAEVVELIRKCETVALAYLAEESEALLVIVDSNEMVYELTPVHEDEWKSLISVLDHTASLKIGWQLKPLLKKRSSLRIQEEANYFDLALAAYLLEPDAKVEWPYIQAKYQLNEYSIDGIHNTHNYLPSLLEAYQKIFAKAEELDVKQLLYNIELPLEHVLARMELHGIAIDLPALKEIDIVLSEQMKDLEAKLYVSAGRKFNIGSPSQTAEILQTIAEPGELKKTKTGQISTAEPFLANLAPKYPFVADLLTYRKLNKIISTYVHSLPNYVNSTTKKIHPTFQQVVAGTGRLICVDPNLQNLPILSEAGREVRKAIVPSSDDFSIVSIDYNQIELRLLAVLSSDTVMLDAFKNGKDIHTTTAARVFRVEEQQVTKEMRSKAKGINFGIAYGITPWGLATRLKISQKEAKEIIDAYFKEFSSVKSYLEASVDETRERGYTRTLFGRIRYIEGIDSKNGTTRKMAERTAVNAPLQGLAADIIKKAMVEIDRLIIAKELKSRLILQVHDELVFEAANTELDTFIPQVIKIMEDVANLELRLDVSATVGKNWLEQRAFAKAV